MRTRSHTPGTGLLPLAAALAAVLAPATALSGPYTYVVTNTSDCLALAPAPGCGSLRQAITDATALVNAPGCVAGLANIVFAIPSGPFVITPATPLPYLGSCAGVTVDATTQPGSMPNTDPAAFNAVLPVILDGSVARFSPYGGCALTLNNGTVRGLAIKHFGYGASGYGLCGSFKVYGSELFDDGTGLRAFSNSVIGSMAPADRNLISGNSLAGIDISYGGSTTIEGNLIGTGPAGMGPVANGTGILASCGASGHYIHANIISGNSTAGIQLGASTSTVIGNRIGLGVTGAPLANLGDGILVNGNCGGFDSNVISTNEIAYNLGNGVRIVGNNVGNKIIQNSIYSNGLKNIDLDFAPGPAPQLAVQPSPLGPNHRQNAPVIATVTPQGNTLVSYSLSGVPSTSYVLEVFENPPGSSYAGKTFVTQTTLTTGATAGPTPGTFILSGLHDYLSMTAINTVTKDTSEFSAVVSFASAPAVTLSPATPIDFGPVAIGTRSATQTVTVTSVGPAPYQISTFDTTTACYGGPFCYGGDFMCSTTCLPSPTLYSTGTSCQVSASFGPNSVGPQSASIVFCDNAAGGPHAINLAGTGVIASPFAITPATYDFGNVLSGKESVVQTFLITNRAATPTSVARVTTVGPFNLKSTTCAASVAPAASCSADVTFAPSLAGPQAGSLVVLPPGASIPASTEDKVLSAATVAAASAKLRGVGIQQAQLNLPTAIDLGAYTLGATPLQQLVELRNTGNAVLSLTSIAVSAPFTLVHDCPVNLAPGAACTVTLGFSSTTIGAFTGSLTVVSNAIGGSGSIALSARAQPIAAPIITVSPKAISFGNVIYGGQALSHQVKITNEGGAPAIFSQIAIIGNYDFHVTTTCGPTLAPQTSCLATVSMAPLGLGVRSAYLLVNSNSTVTPPRVSLSGNGCRYFSPAAARFFLTGC